MRSRFGKSILGSLLSRPMCWCGFERLSKNVRPFIPIYLRKEMEEAKRLGIDINDYLRNFLKNPSPENWVNTHLSGKIESGMDIVEIGPGTGGYAKEVRKQIEGGQLHLFEKDVYWQTYLKETVFNGDDSVLIYECDGFSLKELESGSIDLIYAKGVFTYLNQLDASSYLLDAARVLKRNGKIIINFFDLDKADKLPPLMNQYVLSGQRWWVFNSLSVWKQLLYSKGVEVVVRSAPEDVGTVAEFIKK